MGVPYDGSRCSQLGRAEGHVPLNVGSSSERLSRRPGVMGERRVVAHRWLPAATACAGRRAADVECGAKWLEVGAHRCARRPRSCPVEVVIQRQLLLRIFSYRPAVAVPAAEYSSCLQCNTRRVCAPLVMLHCKVCVEAPATSMRSRPKYHRKNFRILRQIIFWLNDSTTADLCACVLPSNYFHKLSLRSSPVAARSTSAYSRYYSPSGPIASKRIVCHRAVRAPPQA